MNTENKSQRFLWFPTLLIIWNLIDIAVHFAFNLAEPWRIAGNIVGIVAALIVLLGVAKPYARQILSGAAIVVVVLNVIHSMLHGWLIPSFIFIGVSLILLLLWAQDQYRKANVERGDAQNPIYLRWWAAIGATLVGITIVALVGPQAELEIGPLTQLHNGELVGADYWRDEPMILSAGMGFDNIVGLPELTEETVREAGGSWYGSVTCPSGEEPAPVDYTSTSSSDQVSQFFKGFSESRL
jgi:hypothetical protein